MLSSFCSPLNSISDIQGIILVVTAGIISVLIGGHFGGGDHFDGGDHFGGGTQGLQNFLIIPLKWGEHILGEGGLLRGNLQGDLRSIERDESRPRDLLVTNTP